MTTRTYNTIVEYFQSVRYKSRSSLTRCAGFPQSLFDKYAIVLSGLDYGIALRTWLFLLIIY